MSSIESAPLASTTELAPGEWFVGEAPHRVTTLLGSCVSVVLWHPARRVGGMSHFLVPTRGGRDGEGRDGRFGDESLSLIVEALARRDIGARECVAKIFGGGNMFPAHYRHEAAVGRANGEAARRMLNELGVRIVAESLYGIGHRHVLFDLSNGHVWVRHSTGTGDPPPMGAVA